MEKTRELTREEFLNILQLEYFSYRLRSLIYEKPEYKKMNKDISEKKKNKIITISEKIALPNIFTSDDLFEDVWKREFVREFGLPNFQYSPQSQKLSLWDKFYLLKPGTIVLLKDQEFSVKTNYPSDNYVVLENHKNFVPYNYIKIKSLYTISMDKLK